MDQEHFDDLTRSVASGTGTRRQALRVVLGGALGGVAARLGLTEVAAAKKGGSRKEPGQQSRRKPVAHQQRGDVQTASKNKSKRKGNGKNKHKHRDNKPKEKECDELVKLCNQCEEPICIDGDWVCRSNGEKPCDDGPCVAQDACCPISAHGCGNCYEPFCDNGIWGCRFSPAACTCPAGGAACPTVGGVGRWSLRDGSFIDLPDGCCPTEYMQSDTTSGQPFCNYHPSVWWCDPEM